ncbi:MAG: DUF1592 domain-containing protein, partial [Myxococcota bacterium]
MSYCLLVAAAACAPNVVSPGRFEESGPPPPQESEGGPPPSVRPPVEPPSDRPEVAFACDPASAQALFPTEVRRLTRSQYEFTVRDLWARALGPEPAARVLSGLRFSAVPEDILDPEHQVDFDQMDDTVGEDHVAAYHEIGKAIADRVANDPGLREDLLDCGQRGHRDCVTRFVEVFGRLAFRRPVSAEEVDFLMTEVYPASRLDVEALADLITALLNAPSFIYHIELGGEVSSAYERSYALTAHELASRLSYHFWQSLPDEELEAAAQDGTLLQDEVYETQLQRLIDDPKALRGVHRFYAQWLQLDRVPNMDTHRDREDFRRFAGDDLPDADLTEALRTEVIDFLEYYTWVQPGGVSELLTSRSSFARSGAVASLYGGPELWDGTSAPPEHVEPGRSGLLTQAAFLVNNQAVTRPVLRGTFILRRLLCSNMQLPEDQEDIVAPAPEGTVSTRVRYENLTQQQGSSCANCHDVLNPLGFAFEGYDALGRRRTDERIFDSSTGELVGEVPVDSRVDMTFLAGERTNVGTPNELNELLRDSRLLEACMARQYFRFAFAQLEDDTRDACVLENLRRGI